MLNTKPARPARSIAAALLGLALAAPGMVLADGLSVGAILPESWPSAAQAQALRMEVVACDAFVPEAAMHEAGVASVDVDTLFESSDVVTLHAPLTDGTRHVVNARRLAQMRSDAYLVNCARAGLVDHRALGDALGHGVIAGAAIDVFPHEPPPADEPAFGWPNLIVQPHSAWYSPEASLAPYTRQIEDRKSTRLNSSHSQQSRMPSSA